MTFTRFGEYFGLLFSRNLERSVNLCHTTLPVKINVTESSKKTLTAWTERTTNLRPMIYPVIRRMDSLCFKSRRKWSPIRGREDKSDNAPSLLACLTHVVSIPRHGFFGLLMQHLLVVFHSKTGNTQRLADAVRSGVLDPAVTQVELRYLRASDANASDLRWADALILGTPENFGYMSGALKDFFDRTFYEVEGKMAPLPYSLFISAGNDGSGAIRSVERIANGYPLVQVQAPIVSKGDVTPQALAACKDLGIAMALGLEMGIF